MNADELIDRADLSADVVYGRAEGGSDMEALAGALRDLATVVRPLLAVIEANREALDNLRQVVGDLDQRIGRVEEVVDGLPGTQGD